MKHDLQECFLMYKDAKPDDLQIDLTTRTEVLGAAAYADMMERKTKAEFEYAAAHEPGMVTREAREKYATARKQAAYLKSLMEYVKSAWKAESVGGAVEYRRRRAGEPENFKVHITGETVTIK